MPDAPSKQFHTQFVSVDRRVDTKLSLTGGGQLNGDLSISLVNDLQPQPFSYYGTDIFGELGWYGVFIGSGPQHCAGLVPDPGPIQGNTRYLREDGVWTEITNLIQGEWNYSDNTVMANPSNGNLRVNTTTFPAATQMAVSTISVNNVDRSYLLKSLRVGDQILVQDKTHSDNWARYEITSTPVNNTSWFQMGVSYVTGSGTTPASNTNLVASFQAAGGGAGGGGTVTTFSAGNLSPLFTTSVSKPSTTPALSFTAPTQTANLFYGTGASTAAPSFRQINLNQLTGTLTTAQGGVPAGGTSGYVLSKNSGADYDLAWIPPASGGGGGTVTSVGLAMPSEFNVTNSPVTLSGTLTSAWATQGSNLFFGTGATASTVPIFRQINFNQLAGTASSTQMSVGSVTQAWDADLDGISALTNPASSAFLKKSSAGVWSLDTTAYQPAGSYEVPLTFQYSLTRAGNVITLTGDQSAPGASKLYATNAAGTRNWYSAGSAIGVEPYLGTPSTDGYVLSSTVSGTRSWIAPPSAPVTSVFTRTGAIVATEADYQSFYPRISFGYVDPSWITSLAWSKITGAPAFVTSAEPPLGNPPTDDDVLVSTIAGVRSWRADVKSWAGRTGVVTPQSNDYTFAQIGSKPTTLAGYGITDAQPLDADLTSIAGLAGTSGVLRKTAANTWSLDTATFLTSASIGSSVQAWDVDLDAIAALGSPASGTAFIKKSNLGVWSLDTATYLTGNQTIALTGDATGSGATSIAVTIPTKLQWDGGATNLVAATGRSSLGLVIGTNVQAWDGDLDAIAALSGTSGLLKKTADNTWTLDTSTYLTSGAIGSTVQAWDADLDAIAALSSPVSSAFLKKTAANTWTLDTSAYLTGNQSISLTGDITGSGATSIATTYTNVVPKAKGGIPAGGTLGQVYAKNSGTDYDADWTTLPTGSGTVTNFSAGSLSVLFGTSVSNPTTTPSLTFSQTNASAGTVFANNTTVAAVPAFVTNPRITAIANLTSNGFVKTSGGIGTLSVDTTTYQVQDADLDAIAALSGTSGLLKKTAANTWTLDTSTYLTGNQSITLTGDITGSGATSIATTYNNAVPTTKAGLPTGGTTGDVLAKNSATNYDTVWKTRGAQTMQYFTTAGSGTYTTPSGCIAIIVECIGGGAGGGGGQATSGQLGCGGGGGGGSYARKRISSPSASYSYTVGGGGSPGVANAGTGGAGGDTSFGTSLCIGQGGAGGTGMAQGTTYANSAGGAGGTGGTGDFGINGQAGGWGTRLSSTTAIGGGSGGGAAVFGVMAPAYQGAGAANGNFPGGGATGGYGYNTSTAGGTGAAGCIIVTEFY
jgi:hypothetical protein